MNTRKLFRIATAIAVLSFIAAMVNAWLAAPGQMALLTAAAFTVYWVGNIRKDM